MSRIKLIVYTTYTLLLLFFCTDLLGKQDVPPDSLWRKFRSHQLVDTNRVHTLIQLSEAYMNFAPDSSLLQVIQSKKVAQELHFSKGIVLSSIRIAYLYWHFGKYEEALEETRGIIPLAERMKQYSSVAKAYGIIGLVHEMRSDYDSALYFAQKARVISKQYDPPLESNFLLNIAIVYEITGEYQKAFETYELCLKNYTELDDSVGMAKAFNNMGIIYDLQGDYPKALDYYNKSLTMARKLGKQRLVANSINNLAAVYFLQDDFEQAIYYFQKALEIRLIIKHQPEIASSYINLGESYLKLNDLDKSLASFQKAIEFNKEVENQEVQESILAGMAKVHYKKGNFDQALSLAQEALSINKALGIKKGISHSYLTIANIYAKQGKYKEAIEAAQHLLTVSKIIDPENIKGANKILHEVYAKTKDFDRAYQHLHHFHNIQDSLWSIEKTKVVEQIKQALELGFKEKELELYKEKELLLAEKNQQQQSKIISLSVAALLLTLLTIGLFFLLVKNRKLRLTVEDNLVQIHRQANDLQTLNDDMESANDLLAVRNQELKTSNELLQQFAYTASHDIRGPLINIKMLASIVQEDSNELEKIHIDPLSLIEKSADRLLAMVDNLLKFANQDPHLSPPEAVDLNEVIIHVEESLKHQIDIVQGKIEYQNLPVIQAQPSLIEQVIQNLVSNALKFHHPTRKPHIKVAYEKEREVFFVKDNGIGISHKNSEELFNLFQRSSQHRNIEGSGIGLATCKRIVEHFNGKIWFESEEGSGTTFYFTLPIAMHEVHHPQ